MSALAAMRNPGERRPERLDPQLEKENASILIGEYLRMKRREQVRVPELR